MDRRYLLGGLVAGTLGPVPAPAAPQAKMSFTAIPAADRRRNRFPNVALTTHQGKAVRFYDDLLKDKTVLINFIYMTCDGKCPISTATLAGVQRILEPRVGRDIFMYSINLDPEAWSSTASRRWSGGRRALSLSHRKRSPATSCGSNRRERAPLDRGAKH